MHWPFSDQFCFKFSKHNNGNDRSVWFSQNGSDSDENKFSQSTTKNCYYRAGIKDLEGFRRELRNELRTKPKSYFHFETTFKKLLDKYDPIKQRVVRDNDKPFMTKPLRKAIMRRSALKNRFLRSRTDENHKAMKRQKNYTNRLYRRELKKYAGNLDLKSLTDNKKFWDILLPLLSSKGKSSTKNNSS